MEAAQPPLPVGLGWATGPSGLGPFLLRPRPHLVCDARGLGGGADLPSPVPSVPSRPPVLAARPSPDQPLGSRNGSLPASVSPTLPPLPALRDLQK